jgi:hypothetical protein
MAVDTQRAKQRAAVAAAVERAAAEAQPPAPRAASH